MLKVLFSLLWQCVYSMHCLNSDQLLVASRFAFITAQRSCGFVNISGEEVEESKFDIAMQMYAKKLDKKDFFGKVHKIVVLLWQLLAIHKFLLMYVKSLYIIRSM